MSIAKYFLTISGLILLMILFLFAQEITIDEKQYKKENDKWTVYENGLRFDVVNALSIKFRSEKEDLEKFSNENKLEFIRINELGYADFKFSNNVDPIEFFQELKLKHKEKYEDIFLGTKSILLNYCNDDYYTNQWTLDNMDIEGAWDITTGDNDIIIAIIDDGVTMPHDDLGSNVWLNDDIPDGSDNDGNGFTDDRNGWNFEYPGPNISPNAPLASSKHGTCVAGITSAIINNDEGIAGIAGGWNGDGCKFMPIVSTRNLNLDDAILYAKNNDAHVICITQTATSNSSINAAITAAYNDGKIIVASAGNSGGSVVYPANHSSVIAVGATDHDNDRWSYSCFGSELDFVAPSGNTNLQGDVYTTDGNDTLGYNTSQTTTDLTDKDYTKYFGGTSASAPEVAGIIALMLSTNPDMTFAQVKKTLELTATDRGTTGKDNLYGYGIVNAEKAVRDLFVPDVYSTLNAAVNTAITGQQIVLKSGTHILSSDISLGSVSLLVKSGAILTMNTKKITTTSGTITVESGAFVNPDVRLRTSSTVKGLYPSIQSALNAQTSSQNVYLADDDYTENISMKDNSYLIGAGWTQTDIYGKVTFNNVDNAWLTDVRVSQDIFINNGDGNCVDYVCAADAIDIDYGINHEIYECRTSDDGYVDTYCNDPLIEDLTSTNTKTWGITGYGSDPEINYGTFENKTKAINLSYDMDAIIDNADFCTQAGSGESDIYCSSTSSAEVTAGSGTFSDCPFPDSFDGTTANIDVGSSSCSYCGRLSKSIADGEPGTANSDHSAALTEDDFSNGKEAYRDIKAQYSSIRRQLHQDRRKNRFASAEKYAADYQKVIDSALQFINDYPESSNAGKALRLVAYSYPSLHQHDKIMDIAEDIAKSNPRLKAAALQVQIPYYLETERVVDAMSAVEDWLNVAKDTEEQQIA